MRVTKRGDYVSVLLPHNQFLTFVARHGWWLGLFLSFFIIWLQMRSCKIAASGVDEFTLWVMVPSGISIFFIVGMNGQNVLDADLMSTGLACSVFPGLVYGNRLWLNRVQGRFVL